MSDDTHDYTRQAVAAIRSAVHAEHSFPEWLAQVLATAISDHELGGYALISGRPGSWEAHLVHQLIIGTVGETGHRLPEYRRFPGGPDDPAQPKVR